MKAKKLMPILFVLLTSSFGIFAQEPTSPSNDTKFDQGDALPANTYNPGYNAPARIDVNGAWDFFVGASFTYWEAREKGLDLGYSYWSTAAERKDNPGNVLNASFAFKPGFKVLGGMNFNHDNWDSLIRYTWYHSTINTHHSIASGYSLQLSWDEELSSVTSVTSLWKLCLNLLDWELGRSYYNGTNLIIRPFASIKGGWLNQRYNITSLYGTTYVSSYARSKSWLIGPRFGASANWMLGWSFRLEADANASLVYQKFSTTYKEENANTPSNLDIFLKEHIGYLTPIVEGSLGFGWGTYFSHNKWHWDISASYEIQYFWQQNMMRELKDIFYDAVSGSCGDLMLHGLTASMRFDF